MEAIGILMNEHRLIERMINLMKLELESLKSANDADDSFILAVIDFLRNYADKNHHGKEEGILFRELDKKDLTLEHRKIMTLLIDEHKVARNMVWALESARQKHLQEIDHPIADIIESLDSLVKLYPKHIEKEDKQFFFPCMKYFTLKELKDMLKEFEDFDMAMNLTRYDYLVEQYENSKLPNLKNL